MKKEVDKFIATNTTHLPSLKVPAVVNIPENKTVASDKSSEDAVMNERLTAFLQIFFAKPSFDNKGDLYFLEPAVISDFLSLSRD